jgi:hypothetical protein
MKWRLNYKDTNVFKFLESVKFQHTFCFSNVDVWKSKLKK